MAKLVNRPQAASQVSTPAMWYAISERKPVFILDECEKALGKNQLLRSIFNASYLRPLSYVLRVGP